MNNKPGRNEPCPCGSGKKYKKCCMEIDNKMYSFEELGYYKTGNNTYDSFLNVLNAMSSMRDDLAECTRDGLELQGQMKEFVHMFRPGDIYPLSYFTAWSVIDCCFGKSYSSVLEKSAGIQRKKEDKGIELLFEGLLFSYPGFFLVEKSEGKTYFKALYNDERFKIDYVPEKWQVDFREDTLLFTRIFGFANIAFPGIEPLVFTDKAQIKKLIAMDKEDYREFIKHNKLEDEAMSYIDMNREMFIVRLSMFKETVMAKQGVLQEEKKPVITNTDGQLMYFITIYMNVIDEETLVKKLDNMKRIEKGEKNEWVWTVDREIMPGGGNTIRGLIRKKRDELIVEVNSFQRAVKILNKFDKELSREAVYTRHEVKEVDRAMLENRAEKNGGCRPPEPLSPEEQSEIDAKIAQMQQDYYMKKWPRMKIPDLGDITPHQAAKTQEGRKKLSALIETMEKMQQEPDKKDFDFNKLRKKFGL